MFPAGEAQPTTANLNFAPGQTVGNAVVSKVGVSDQVSIYNALGEVHVIVDLNGTYDAALRSPPVAASSARSPPWCSTPVSVA